MADPTTTMLRIGEWCVDPKSGEISRDGESTRLEGRTMLLLLCLAKHSGEVVSIDDLLDQVWTGVNVAPDSVYQAVTSLRRVLGDDPKQPTYIATVPRLGYRMVARVSPWEESSAADGRNTGRPSAVNPSARGAVNAGLRGKFLLIAGAAICLVLLVSFLVLARRNHSASSALAAQPQRSIAVVPFLDLTEGMHEEEFADGMTEELIDKLSKIPGLQVPPPTSSFYFKGKQVAVADFAKALGVAYVLDGSVRKSGGRLRVAARLIRAENGYVVWSEAYDRPSGDVLMIQDDIAGEVTKALKSSIVGNP